MDDDGRPIKRIKRACETCRRKKSRCSGERPVCSNCTRLGHHCEYAAEEAPEYVRGLEQRLGCLESKLEVLLACSHHTPAAAPASGTNRPNPDASGEAQIINDPLINFPDATPQNPAHLFLTYCNFQPLPLFPHRTFLESYDSRDAEVQLAIQALGQRFDGRGVADLEIDREIRDWTESSRRMVMSRLAEGAVELSTLQTLCLLTLIDYTNGNIIRTGVNLRLAKYLIECLKLDGPNFPDNLEDERDERVLCRWTVYILETLASDGYSAISSNPVNTSTRTDVGLVACTVQYSKVWGLSRAYASAHIRADSPSPWSPQSDYSVITSELMECESRIPLKYRLHASEFPELSAAELDQHRQYWGPWLFFQFVSHSILALVNHPLLLSMRLKNFRHTMPQSFLRNSFEQITINTGWVLHFVTLLEKKGFEVSDPTLGQCVAIVATIFLQHSFVEEASFRQKAQIGYEKCIGFVHQMGRRWPHLEKQANKLRQLSNSISGGAHGSQQAWSVNVHLLWEILVSSPSKQTRHPPNDIFGPSLRDSIPQNSLRSDDASPDPEFALIGSAGISGHRTVARELVTYPPEEVQHFHNSQNQIPDLDLSGLIGNPELGISGSGGGLLQPQDYGRLIENWLNLEP
ncbi:putative Zn(II)2Cys6 transcription factor [Aspergillus steynii IBT 23096]|uniref:Putative Zn(II)2Cys6 transcription factor n=1 Tax=Aspergillus steynii IBT 23096 TaxID=1392250 RepID=A0A2I2GAY6_9EURO|nr:putative Zn(II)2Cys6 transcription factor [Aspergillus steynii IBT 23096]PLB50025.1 putative Zn(II)2Cys6 transcription factor [Aspergillus steynii IBT 23096]